MKNLFRLSSGQEVASEQIISCEYTETVNSGAELTLGSVCSASLKFTVRTSEALFREGTQLEYYVIEGDVRTQMGVFICQKPSYRQANQVEVEAYDAVSQTEADLSPWLRENQGLFPMPLYDFAAAVCGQCGLTLANESIPNGDYSVPAFYADGLTGRQLLQWAGEIAARFIRATPDGRLEFAWYTDKRSALQQASQHIGPTKGFETVYLYDSDGAQLVGSDGALLVTDEIRGHAYYQGSLSYEEYNTAPIEKVQIKQAEDDVGVVWPDDAQALNTYTISGNYLLLTETEDAVKAVAKAVFEALQGVQYRPCSVTIPATTEIRAGDIVEVQDANGESFATYIFTRTCGGGRDTLESTGSPRRDSSTAVNRQSYSNLQGKVLLLQTSVDGLRVINRDLTGKYAELSLTVDGLTSTVQDAVLSNLLSDPNFSNKENTDAVTYADGGAVISNVQGYGMITNDLSASVLPKIRGKSLTAKMALWQDAGAEWSADNGFISAQFKVEYADGSAGSWYQLFATRKPYGDNTPNVPLEKTEYVITADVPDKEISRAYLYLDFQAYTGTLHTEAWFVSYDDPEYAAKQFSTVKQTVDNIALSVTNGSTSSVLTLRSGDITFSTAEVKFTGLVSFSDLRTEGKTTIIGPNIKTGKISASDEYTTETYFDLDNGVFYAGKKIPGGSANVATYLSAGYMETSFAGHKVVEIGPDVVDEELASYGHLYLSGPGNYWGVKMGVGTAGGEAAGA